MQIDIDRQKFSRHFNLALLVFQLIVMDFWFLKKTGKPVPIFSKKFLLDITAAFRLGKKPGNFGGSKSGISDWQKAGAPNDNFRKRSVRKTI